MFLVGLSLKFNDFMSSLYVFFFFEIVSGTSSFFDQGLQILQNAQMSMLFDDVEEIFEAICIDETSFV
jgi:hypothetical protein